MKSMIKAKMKALEDLVRHMQKQESNEEENEPGIHDEGGHDEGEEVDIDLVGPKNPAGKMAMDKSLSLIGKKKPMMEDEGEEEDMDEEEEVPLSEREQFMKDRKSYMQRGLSSPMKGGKTKVMAMSLKIAPKKMMAKK